ncbi:polysaccharide deacetylase family protein [Actinomadura algeriensis]|uniref:Peptidoglycan/xylan/chitin deacetylase (PgdA/CDA1 family) n=1 Tax=Actinomadura algeriensis TaxID=1679523 RepID=A0ABR9K570_9ACTN|nr:polysaccharide deacetylase family protein [Actinomadura algeriensis]MBE1537979.1 peptidoglycan/xylan/chitin deacetylase (PgdA/CDA1 family) [Actinomadura algeriensis]
MDGPGLVRRGAAAVLAAAVCGWLSTLAPSAGRAEPVAVQVVREVPPEPEPKPPPVPEVDCARAKCVALTFDDGPVPGTAELLDVLDARGVRATFFVVGEQAAEHPELVRREHLAGHEIGNHSYTHADLGAASKRRVVEELRKTQDAVRRATGFTPVLLRPPYGSMSGTLTREARRTGLSQVLWSVDPQDWSDRDSGSVERRVVEGARPGAVVLMHDIHGSTVDAVPDIIDRLREDGYVFVTVSQLFDGRLAPGEEYVERKSGQPQGLP